jgi:hypothetical protein
MVFLYRGLKLLAEFCVEPAENGQSFFEPVVEVILGEARRGVEQDLTHWVARGLSLRPRCRRAA